MWSYVMNELAELFPAHACSEFLASWRELGFSPRRVPQLQEVSEFLQARSGWQIRPVAGLLHPRDFLNGLAFRTFHSTQYMRHGADPCWTPEPDIVHEMIGHVPMLAHPAFCQLAHAIGVASLGADEAQIWHLTKCYWYTVEFGVVREGGGVKAFGAGVLSSYGEMKNMASGRAGLREFDPFQKQPKMSYSDGCGGGGAMEEDWGVHGRRWGDCRAACHAGSGGCESCALQIRWQCGRTLESATALFGDGARTGVRSTVLHPDAMRMHCSPSSSCPWRTHTILKSLMSEFEPFPPLPQSDPQVPEDVHGARFLRGRRGQAGGILQDVARPAQR